MKAEVLGYLLLAGAACVFALASPNAPLLILGFLLALLAMTLIDVPFEAHRRVYDRERDR